MTERFLTSAGAEKGGLSLAAGRDKLGRWEKGVSGNPAGRKRALPDSILGLFTENTDKAIKKLIKLMDDPDPNVRLAATKYFIDKGIGSGFRAYIDEDADGDNDMTVRIIRGKRKDG